MSANINDTEKSEPSRARTIRGRNGGTLTPFRPGEGQKTGYRKPNNYVETLHLALKSSPDAMRTLIKCLNDPDSRTAVVAANSILERAWGKPREMKPDECSPSVSTRPGLMELTRICFDPSSLAKVRVRPSTAALLAL